MYLGYMSKIPIDIDDAALEAAQRELGTKTKKDTVNEALRFVARRQQRVARALALANPDVNNGVDAEEDDNPYLGIGAGADVTNPEIMKQARR